MKNYKPDNDLLHKRVILVTGAGSGIGKAAALSFAEHGANVILLDRNEAKINAVYDEIEASNWPEAVLFPLDLASATRDEYDAMAAAIDKEYGRLDGLLNNAGIPGTLTPLHLYEDSLWHKLMQVNLRAPYELTRACFNLLQASADATVIFTTGDVGKKGKAYWGAYGITAFAIEGMTQIWADELAEDSVLRINAVNPGAVNTDFRTRLYPGDTTDFLPGPQDIMSVYLYLIGPDSKGVNGQSFNAQDD